MKMQASLKWLAGQSAVHWIAPKPKLHLNNFYATGITENQAAGTCDLNAGTTSPYADTHQFFASSLQVRIPESLISTWLHDMAHVYLGH